MAIMLYFVDVLLERIVFKIFAIVWASLLLVGCAGSPDYYGFSKEEWALLSEKEKDTVIKGRRYILHHKGHFVGLDEEIKRYKSISVSIDEGTILLWPKKERIAFKKHDFVIKNGYCEILMLPLKDDQNKAALKACYKYGVFYLENKNFGVWFFCQ